MTGGVVLALDYHFVIVFVVAVDEKGEELRNLVSEVFCEVLLPRCQTYECDEEGERRNNRQRPASFEHRARLVDVDGPRAVALAAVVSERSQVEVNATGREVGAVCIRDCAHGDDSSDQCSNKTEIDEGDEERIVARSEIVE